MNGLTWADIVLALGMICAILLAFSGARKVNTAINKANREFGKALRVLQHRTEETKTIIHGRN